MYELCHSIVNMGIYVPLYHTDFNRVGYITRNVIAGSNVVLFLVFLGNLHTEFQSACTNLYSHQKCRGYIFPEASQTFNVLCTLYDSHLTGMKIST